LKPESSGLHVHPLTEESSELGDEITAISSGKSGFSQEYYYAGDQSKLARFAIVLYIPLVFTTKAECASSRDWHSDITFEPIPSDYTILKVEVLYTISYCES
jgi:alpha-ketoglutarate-dependent taurine dioxygenase